MKCPIVILLIFSLLTACQGTITNEEIDRDVLWRAYRIDYKPPAASTVSLPTIMAAFDTMAFEGRARVTRWGSNQTIKIKTVGNTTKAEGHLIELITKDLSSNISLKFEMVNDDPDITIRFLPVVEHKFHCRAVRRISGPTSQLSRVTILVSNGSASIMETTVARFCLARKFLQAIGFPGHTPWFHSNSNISNRSHYFTPWDYIFIRALYDNSLEPGTPRHIALRNACEFITKHLVLHRRFNRRTGAYDPTEYCLQLTAANTEIIDAKAQLEAGRDYENGWHVEKNEQRAFEFYVKAAEQGHPPAQTQIGLAFRKGVGVQKDEKTAIQWFKKAADNKDPAAQMLLAFAYANGTGLERNQKLAFQWFEIAIDKLGPETAAGIGWAYEKGSNVPKDISKALRLYKRAALGGATTGYAMLARAYLEGIGVDKNQNHGKTLAISAALAGDAVAQHVLAVWHSRQQDLVESYKWAVLTKKFKIPLQTMKLESDKLLKGLADRLSLHQLQESRKLAERTESEIRKNGTHISVAAKKIVENLEIPN